MVGGMHLRQNNVLGVGLALLGDGVHEGLGGEAGGFGGCQPLCHAVHVHILCKSFLHITECICPTFHTITAVNVL